MIAMLSVKTLQWMVYGFLAIIVAIVFQQVYTSMTEQGIASGGPYNNGAAYPRAIAITIGVLLVCQIFTDRFSTESEQEITRTTMHMDMQANGHILRCGSTNTPPPPIHYSRWTG